MVLFARVFSSRGSPPPGVPADMNAAIICSIIGQQSVIFPAIPPQHEEPTLSGFSSGVLSC
jgi:hypothetical protein